MAMTQTWNENTPADTDLISGGDDIIRDLKKAVRERMDVEHVFTTGNEANVGEHTPGFITAGKAYLADDAVVESKILNNQVTNAKLAQVLGATFKGRATAGTGDVEDLSVAQALSLLGVQSGATDDQTAGEILAALITVDGHGTSLDADLLDGQHGSYYAPATQGVTNGNAHDHSGGDGAQITHASLAGAGSYTHAQIDGHVGSVGGHGVTTVVGAAESQVLYNKYLSGAVVTANPTAALGVAPKQYVDQFQGVLVAASSKACSLGSSGTLYIRTGINDPWAYPNAPLYKYVATASPASGTRSGSHNMAFWVVNAQAFVTSGFEVSGPNYVSYAGENFYYGDVGIKVDVTSMNYLSGDLIQSMSWKLYRWVA